MPSSSAAASSVPEPVMESTPIHTAAAGNNYVQLGAFSSAENAEALRQKYLERFPNLQTFATLGELPVLYKVRQGPFASRAQAEVVASRMEMAGVEHVSLAQDDARIASVRGATIPAPKTQQTFIAPASSPTTMVANSPSTFQRNRVAVPQKGKVYVQIGAFSSISRAQQVRDRYTAQYASAQVYNPRPGEPDIYRVRIGPIEDVKKVGSIVDQLEASGLKKAIVVVGK